MAVGSVLWCRGEWTTRAETLTRKVHTQYLLHDGRARTIEGAILWHGGEASAASAGFRALDADDRAELVAFLESL